MSKKRRDYINFSRPDSALSLALSEAMVKKARARVKQELKEHDEEWIELTLKELNRMYPKNFYPKG